jgi:hypothetical protein
MVKAIVVLIWELVKRLILGFRRLYKTDKTRQDKEHPENKNITPEAAVKNEETVVENKKYPPKPHKSFGHPEVLLHFTKYGIPKLGWLQRDVDNEGKSWIEANDGVDAGAYGLAPGQSKDDHEAGGAIGKWLRIAWVYIVLMPIATFWQSPRWRHGMKVTIASYAIAFAGILIGLPFLLLIPFFWMLHEVGYRLLKRDGYQDIVVEYWGFGKESSNADTHILVQNILTAIYALVPIVGFFAS